MIVIGCVISMVIGMLAGLATGFTLWFSDAEASPDEIVFVSGFVCPRKHVAEDSRNWICQVCGGDLMRCIVKINRNFYASGTNNIEFVRFPGEKNYE